MRKLSLVGWIKKSKGKRRSHQGEYDWNKEAGFQGNEQEFNEDRADVRLIFKSFSYLYHYYLFEIIVLS